MTATISYFVIASLAYVVSVLWKNFTMGFWIAFTVHAAWIGLVDFGPLVDEWDALVLYYITATMFAFLGFSFAKVWHHPPLLNGTYLSHTFYGFAMKPKPNADTNGVTRIGGKIMFWLLLQVGAHIVFDLRVADFPQPWPGVVTTVVLILLYVVLYFILRDEDHIFKSEEKSRRSEVATYSFWFGLTHIVYCLVYWIVEFAISESAFFDDMWNFWISLIVFGVFLIVTFLTSSGARKAEINPQHEYKPMKQEADGV